MPNQDAPFQYHDIDTQEVSYAYRTPTLTCTETQISSNKCTSYVTIEYRSSGIEDTCTRTYTEILSAISEVGGIKELLFMLAGLLYLYYNDIYYERYLRRTFYPEDEINAYCFAQDSQKCKNNEVGNEVVKEKKPELVSSGKSQNSFVLKSRQNHERRINSINPEQEKLSLDRNRRGQSSKNIHNGLLQEHPATKISTRLSSNYHENHNSQPNDHRPDKNLASLPKSPSINNLKKPQLSKALKFVKSNAMEIFTDLTSVESLIAELGSWKVFKEIVFGKHHLKLLPLVLIEIERKKKISEKKRESEVAQSNTLPRYAKSICKWVGEVIDIQEAIELLHSPTPMANSASCSREKDEQSRQGVIDCLQKGVSEFFLDNLPDFLTSNNFSSSTQQINSQDSKEKEAEDDWVSIPDERTKANGNTNHPVARLLNIDHTLAGDIKESKPFTSAFQNVHYQQEAPPTQI